MAELKVFIFLEYMIRILWRKPSQGFDYEWQGSKNTEHIVFKDILCQDLRPPRKIVQVRGLWLGHSPT